jgi:hypothetical protein
LSTEKTTYQLIANILSKAALEQTLKAALQDFQAWEALVAIGSQQLVLPALYRCLKSKKLLDLIPADLKDYLKSLHDINYQRNLSINQQLQVLAELFETHNISYVLLKGAALLQYLNTEDLGQRMIGDIDLLVPEALLYKAQDLLIQSGYKEAHGFNYQPKGFRHLNRLVHAKQIAAVELHRSPLNAKHEVYLSASQLLDSKVQQNGLWVPHRRSLVAHNILSLQLTDGGHYYKTLSYRCMYDGLLLSLNQQDISEEAIFQSQEIHSFLAMAGCLFEDYHDLSHPKALKKAQSSIKFRFGYPGLFTWQLRLKRLWQQVWKRIVIFSTNASYRRHVLKNKIFPRFL